MKPVDSNTIFDAIIPVIKTTGAYQKSRWNTALQISHKGDINLVTEVDTTSEKMLVDGIQKHFPEHDILAEEGSGTRKDSTYKWIIDPLDGTTNFAHSYPLFAISVALEYKGALLAGMVYDPLKDELFQAYKNEGAFLNNNKISVSAVNNLNKALLATGFAYNLRETDNNNIIHFNNMLYKAQAVRRDGVASIDLCYLACGRYDGFWELNLFPWDTAAGTIIVLEAGGMVTCFDGSPYTVYERDILITNKHIHKEIQKILKQGINRLNA